MRALLSAFSPNSNFHFSFVVHYYADHHWSATDLAILGVLLIFNGRIDGQIDGLAAIRAVDRYEFQCTAAHGASPSISGDNTDTRR